MVGSKCESVSIVTLICDCPTGYPPAESSQGSTDPEHFKGREVGSRRRGVFKRGWLTTANHKCISLAALLVCAQDTRIMDKSDFWLAVCRLSGAYEEQGLS